MVKFHCSVRALQSFGGQLDDNVFIETWMILNSLIMRLAVSCSDTDCMQQAPLPWNSTLLCS
jgi:hypothetical protein